ncbi:MAG: matrixin family metalloprotease [Oligoflexia bacterium]|nr:matrixin family metalloprotease [Oligoflexia bacterium]
MLKKSKLYLAIAGLTLTLVTSCSPKNSDPAPHHPKVVNNTYFINGDPRELIADSELNTQSPFTSQNIKNFDGFYLTMAHIFVDKTKFESAEEMAAQETKSSEQLVRDRKAPEYSPVDHAEKYVWKTLHNGEVVLQTNNSQNDKPSMWRPLALNFHFTPDISDGRLQLKAISSASTNAVKSQSSVEIKHYSVHESGNAFSLLFYAKEGDSKYLLSYWFTKRDNNTQFSRREALSPYTLIMGPKVDVHWPQKQKLTMQVCGVNQPELLHGIKRGINTWKTVLTNRLSLETEIKSKCPPFSDLNTHTIRIIDKYKMMQTEGFAMDIVGRPEQGLIDGDIHLLIDATTISVLENLTIAVRLEISDKLKSFEDAITLVIAHEMGHVLGLQHQYESDSIMNYNWDYLKKQPGEFLTPYDRSAIQTLYTL